MKEFSIREFIDEYCDGSPIKLADALGVTRQNINHKMSRNLAVRVDGDKCKIVRLESVQDEFTLEEIQ